MRYNYETLTTYCCDNEIQIIPIDKTKCNRETVIEGKCKTPNCLESFSKSFRQMVKCGGFCSGCSKTIGMVKNVNTNLEKHTESLNMYYILNNKNLHFLLNKLL